MTSKLFYVPLFADDLRALGACESQVLLFEQRFPNGATPDDAHRADGLNVEWLLQILDWESYKVIEQTASEAYNTATQPAREAYKAIQQPALEAYTAAIQPAREAYEAETQPALEAYTAAIQPAREAYEAETQPALEVYMVIKRPAQKVQFATIRAASLDALRALWPVWEE